MESEDADFFIDYIAVNGKAQVVASVGPDHHENENANNEEDSCDSFSTDASLATSVIPISATSSDNDDDQVIPKSSKTRKKSRVIQSDSDESGSDCKPPPAKIKKNFRRIKPVKDNSSSSSESEQDDQQSSSRSDHNETTSEDSDDEVQESSDQEEASRRSRRLQQKQKPRHAESPKRRYKITFEDESEDEDDSGTERSRDSEESDDSDDSNDDDQCYICKELDPDLDVSEREDSKFSSWCECKCCAPTEGLGDYDRICCQELKGVRRFLGDELAFRKKCITEHPRFAIDVLKFQALKRTKTRSSFKCKSRSRCFKAEWSFLRMIYDRIGSGEQAVIPACVFKAIFNRFHNDGLWHNWYAKYHCKKGPHCHNMELRKEIEL